VPILKIFSFHAPRGNADSGDARHPVLMHDTECLGGIPTRSVGTRKNLAEA